MSKVWGIPNDTLSATELVSGGFVSLGLDEIGDLRSIGDDQEAMKRAVSARYPQTKPGAVPGLAGYLRRMLSRLFQRRKPAGSKLAQRQYIFFS